MILKRDDVNEKPKRFHQISNNCLRSAGASLSLFTVAQSKTLFQSSGIHKISATKDGYGAVYKAFCPNAVNMRLDYSNESTAMDTS